MPVLLVRGVVVRPPDSPPRAGRARPRAIANKSISVLTRASPRQPGRDNLATVSDTDRMGSSSEDESGREPITTETAASQRAWAAERETGRVEAFSAGVIAVIITITAF